MDPSTRANLEASRDTLAMVVLNICQFSWLTIAQAERLENAHDLIDSVLKEHPVEAA